MIVCMYMRVCACVCVCVRACSVCLVLLRLTLIYVRFIFFKVVDHGRCTCIFPQVAHKPYYYGCSYWYVCIGVLLVTSRPPVCVRAGGRAGVCVWGGGGGRGEEWEVSCLLLCLLYFLMCTGSTHDCTEPAPMVHPSSLSAFCAFDTECIAIIQVTCRQARSALTIAKLARALAVSVLTRH